MNVRLPSGFFEAVFDIDGLPAGRTVVLEGLSPVLTGFSLSSFLQLRNCAGRVHCDDLDVDLGGTGAIGISISDCTHVSIHASSLRNGPTMIVQNSTVLITDSSLVGPYGIPTSEGIDATDSHLTIARSVVQGGVHPARLSPFPGILASRGKLLIAGGVETRIMAGAGGPGTQASAIAVTTVRVPSLNVSAGPPGGWLMLDLLATSGDLAAVALSVPFGPVESPIPGSGEIWIDFNLLLNLGSFTVPGSEKVQINLTVPAVPSIRGAVLTSQALTASAAAGFRFSTPATFVLN